jgi:hypothetical protein
MGVYVTFHFRSQRISAPFVRSILSEVLCIDPGLPVREGRFCCALRQLLFQEYMTVDEDPGLGVRYRRRPSVNYLDQSYPIGDSQLSEIERGLPGSVEFTSESRHQPKEIQRVAGDCGQVRLKGWPSSVLLIDPDTDSEIRV